MDSHQPSGAIAENLLARQNSAENNSGNNHSEEKEIVGAIELKLCAFDVDFRPEPGSYITEIVLPVYEIENRQDNHHVDEKNRQKAEAPCKRNSVHEAHEKRRVTYRCKAAPHI